MPDGSATAHLYWPKLLTILREGYSIVAGCVLAALFAALRRAIPEEGA
jgi:hypothetical protein